MKSSAENIRIVAVKVLDAHFPETLHREILDTVGLDLNLAEGKQRRSPDFRRKVLRAYEGRCCVCGYDLRLGNRLAGLEAAHIMWHTVGGPDEEPNGLALCVLHHKAFDLGAFTVEADSLSVLCSQELSGTTKREWLIGYHGSRISKPQSLSYCPEERYLNWHRKTIFKGPPRERGNECAAIVNVAAIYGRRPPTAGLYVGLDRIRRGGNEGFHGKSGRNQRPGNGALAEEGDGRISKVGVFPVSTGGRWVKGSSRAKGSG